MQPEELRDALARLLAHSPSFPGESLVVDLIANPRAGGFTRPSFAKKRFAELSELVARAESLPARSGTATVRLHLTERSGHASDIAATVAEAARADPAGTRRLILTAGGDGTSLETASVLASLPPGLSSRIGLLRLPFGTGNDGSEGRDLTVALGRFLGPVGLAPRPALRIVPNPEGGRAPLYSFNIASLGLDAFVCEMTNKLKASLPGNSYKFWVDFSSVFYDLIWPPAPFRVRAFDAAGSEIRSFERQFLLLAMGASGRRTYGANKPILPDEDNVCGVYQISLLKKLKFKDQVASGGHRGLEDIATLFSASRLVIDYPKAILLQRDGEVDRLEARDFPLAMELTEPLYRVVAPEGAAR